jgi:hypothetical protein
MSRSIRRLAGAALAVAAVATGVGAVFGAVAGGGAFLGLGAGTVGAFFAKSFVTNLVLGGLSQALAKKPRTPALTQRDQTVSVRQPVAPHQVIYGRTRVGGTIVYIESTDNNRFLHTVIALAGHEVDAIEKVYFNDEEINVSGGGFAFNDKARVQYKLGTDDQTAFADLVSESNGLWTSNHRLRGIACVYIRLEFDVNQFPNGVPNFSFLIRGKKVFDPRSNITAWSVNPALCLNDYLTNEKYGLGAVYADEIDSNELIAAANICDEQINLDAGGTENRYECHGVFDTSQRPEDIINGMLSSMAGKAVWASGKWRIIPGVYYTPTLTFDESDLRGGIRVQSLVSRRENFNSIKGVFSSKDQNYIQADFPPIVSQTFISQDSNEQVFKNIELPFTTSASMAQRLAKIELLKARQQVTATVPMKLTGLKANVGDIIQINNTRMGWNGKLFEVISINMTLDIDLGVDLELREISTDVFDWSTSEEQPFDPAPNTNLPDPFAVAVPTNLVVQDTNVIAKDGTTQAGILITWDATPNAFVTQYEVQWLRGASNFDYGSVAEAAVVTVDYGTIVSTPTSFADYGSVADPTAAAETDFNTVFVTQPYHVIVPAISGADYVIRVRAINTLGVRSGFATSTGVTFGDTLPPNPPTDILAFGGYRQITVSWVNPSVADFDYVEVYRNTTSQFSTATLVATIRGNTFVDAPLGISVQRFYFLVAVDRSGNKSTPTSAVTATTQFIDSDSFSQEVLNLFTEAGAFGIEPVSQLPQTGDFDGQIKYDTSVNKLYRWDAANGVWTDDIFSITAGSVDEASFAAGLEPVKIVTSLPNPTGYTGAKIVFLTIDNKLYRYTGTDWTTSVAASDIAGTLAASNFSQNLRPVEVVSALPSTGNFQGRTVLLTTDNKIYRWTGTAWTASVPTTDLSGTITAGQIAAGAITAGKIAVDAVTAGTIAAGAVGVDQLAANSVITGKIAAGAVTADRIAVNAITAEKIQAGAIQTDKIAASAITGGLIAASGVITSAAQIDDAVITNAKIQNGAITTAKIGDAQITNAKIADTLSSTNFVSGSTGWRIQKTGAAEFNDVVISRPLQVDTGDFFVGNLSDDNSNTLRLRTEFFIETNTASAAWSGPNETFLVLVGAKPASGSIVFALNPNVSSQPQNIQWGWHGEVVPMTRWSGPQRLFIKVEFYTRLVDRIENYTLQWRLYKVT